MSFRDLIQDVFRTLWAHRVRTVLTMFGIAWGVVSIVLMVAAGEGLRVGQAKQAETLGRDLMIVFHGRTSLQAGGTRAGRLVHWVDSDIPHLQEEAPDCQYAIPELEQDTVRSHTAYNAAAFTVTGSTPEFAEIRSLGVSEGRFYDQSDITEGRRVAFLGSDAKKQLFGSRPAARAVRLSQRHSLHRYRRDVVQETGLQLRRLGHQQNLHPLPAMRRDFPDKPPGTPETFDQLLVVPRSVEHHEACKGEIRRVLGRLHDFDPSDKEACPIWDTIQEAKAFRTMTDGMKYFLGAVGIVTLFLGGLGVMNVMLVAVRERTREIGVRKAIGAPAHSILRQFFLEALMVALISGGTGLLIAFGLCALVDLLPDAGFLRRPVAHLADGRRGHGRSRNHRHPVGLVSGPPRRRHRSHRSLASRGGWLAWA